MAVHVYTASGAVLAFLATLAAFRDDFRAALLWLFAANVVDATDGVLARAARVRERTPFTDGAHLDDIVDYVTFVFVPALVLYRSGALPDTAALAVVCAVLLSSAYGFSRTDAKTPDGFFTGFPSYWNIMAAYIVAAGTPAWLNAAVLIGLSALVFAPVGWIYPTRMPTLRTLTIVLGALWSAVLLAVLVRLPEPSPRLLAVSLFFPVYYTVLSVYLHMRR
jgi:phosphatidylcholine synthase